MKKIKINTNIFRAYDIRGIYPDDLNDEVAFRTSKAIAELYPHAQTFVIARDPRHSSPALAKAITKGFIEAGKQVIDLGIAPDSLFYFALLHYGYDGGIAISGSHNPKEYNGLTLNVRKKPNETAEDIIGNDLEKVQDRVLSGEVFLRAKRPGSIRAVDLIQDYIDYVAGKIKLTRPLKVVLDVGNGACGLLPEKIFKKLGCQVKTLFAEPDGSFPNHLPDPYEDKNLVALKQAVLQEKADIGFAFDTDGDRVGPIDSKGRRVSGDSCLLMLARQALAQKKGPIVHCMRVSKAFLDEMALCGVKTYFSVSFHEAVRKKIEQVGAVFGGEVTYHYLFPLDYYLCDEALFSALKIAEIASEKDDFVQYIDNLPHYFASPEVFIATPDNEKEALIQKLQDYLRENNYDFIDIDGARVNFENGWALARYANTSPFIKCRFEGVTQKDLVAIEKKSLQIFEKVGIPVKPEHYQILDLN